ncbi:hypothetical protein C6499_21615 [Candidatus Poribacteria bacterium]|nr:MAG: hypothetical protein C6499_21615 [Candidatus Poribacteria bacterium]
MNRLNFVHIVCLIGIVVSFSVIASPACIAEEKTGTLSGVVLDMKGKPISGFSISLSPIFQISKTDAKGAFTFTDIPAGRVQILIPVQPFIENEKPVFNPEPDDQIVSIKIGDITIYQDRHPPFGGTTFSVNPGSHFKNIVVTVRPRMRIRAKVIFKDGKPLTNTSIRLIVQSNGTSSSGVTTDFEGHFVHYLDDDDIETPYIVSVKYKGLSAKSERFQLEENGRYDDLVLTLDGNASATVATQSARPRESLPNILRKLTGTPKPSDKPAPVQPPAQPGRVSTSSSKTTTEIRPSVPAEKIQRSGKKNTWAVNPMNGHAYKKIRCGSLKDAKNRAAAEGASLVAINDAAEQKWLLGLFGNHLYWIGLSDAEKEGEWVWQNGEPLTYTNWGDKHSFPRSTLSSEEKDSAVMTFVNGQWHAVGPGDLLWRTTRYAILEKADVSDSSPAEEE